MFSKNKSHHQHSAVCPAGLPQPPNGQEMLDDLLNIRANDPLLKLFPYEIFVDDSASSTTKSPTKFKATTIQQLSDYIKLQNEIECSQLSLSEERLAIDSLKVSLKNRLDDINLLLKSLEPSSKNAESSSLL